MSKKSPLAVVNDQFGGKDKLVDKLVALLETDESKEELRKRLLSVANTKLLKLHAVASAVKEKWGSREKLLEAAAGPRGKDKDYVARLGGYSTARLVDVAKVSTRKAKAAAAAPEKKKPAAKKPRASKNA